MKTDKDIIQFCVWICGEVSTFCQDGCDEVICFNLTFCYFRIRDTKQIVSFHGPLSLVFIIIIFIVISIFLSLSSVWVCFFLWHCSDTVSISTDPDSMKIIHKKPAALHHLYKKKSISDSAPIRFCCLLCTFYLWSYC